MDKKLSDIDKNNKKIILIFFISLLILITIVSSILFVYVLNDETKTNEHINIVHSSDDVTVDLKDKNQNIKIKSPNGDIIDELNEDNTSTVINKFSTDTTYGEYQIINSESTVIDKFIIEEPMGDSTLKVNVVNSQDEIIEGANVTIDNTTRETSSEGTVKFYDIEKGYHTFTAEANQYENYRTTFEIISEEMNITVKLNDES